MAYPLPDEIKQQAAALCGDGNLEVLDPGTMYKTDDGRLLVAVRARTTKMMLWLEVPHLTKRS